ncbi:hypothetical protein BpHYR1_024082, partial [Brachionus plicatilis]
MKQVKQNTIIPSKSRIDITKIGVNVVNLKNNTNKSRNIESSGKSGLNENENEENAVENENKDNESQMDVNKQEIENKPKSKRGRKPGSKNKKTIE